MRKLTFAHVCSRKLNVCARKLCVRSRGSKMGLQGQGIRVYDTAQMFLLAKAKKLRFDKSLIHRNPKENPKPEENRPTKTTEKKPSEDPIRKT